MAKRLIEGIPEERVAPDWVFARLREIDPTIEVVYVDNGWWWIGSVKPNTQRAAVGQATLKFWKDRDIEMAWPIRRQEMLKAQGFGLISKVRNGHQDPEWPKVIEDVRRADWIWRHKDDPNPEVQEQLASMDDINDERKLKARKAVRDRIEADERYLFSRVLRRNPAPVTVGIDLS